MELRSFEEYKKVDSCNAHEQGSACADLGTACSLNRIVC